MCTLGTFLERFPMNSTMTHTQETVCLPVYLFKLAFGARSQPVVTAFVFV
jgi:hypothetical protein